MTNAIIINRGKWYLAAEIYGLIGIWLAVFVITDRSKIQIYIGLVSSILLVFGLLFFWVKSMEFNCEIMIIRRTFTSKIIERSMINGFDEFGNYLFVNLTDGSKRIVPILHIDRKKVVEIKRYLNES